MDYLNIYQFFPHISTLWLSLSVYPIIIRLRPGTLQVIFIIMQSETIPHDAAYKDFFTDRNMVKSLLSDFAPPSLLADLDLDTLEKYPDCYVADNLERRQSDAIWRIKSGDGWRFILIMLEFQSSQDRWMALRVLAYTALLWEDLLKRDLIKADDKLPPVLPVVI